MEAIEMHPRANRHKTSTLCLGCQSLFMRPSVSVDVPLQPPLQYKFCRRFSKHCDHCATLQRAHIRTSDFPWLSLSSSNTVPVDWRLIKKGPENVTYYAMRYMAAGDPNHSPSLALDPKLDRCRRASIGVHPFLHSDSTDSASCFEQMRQWVQTCQSEHKTCRRLANKTAPHFLPTRLIDITGDPRLIISQQDNRAERPTRYTTVSHRWGQANMPRLLRSNIEELQAHIHSSYLTPVFRDAVTVTRQLGFDYVWIDALCIVQDDIEDWQREASLMGLVYQKASCNLGATASQLKTHWPGNLYHSDGMFQSRSPAKLALLNVQIVRNNHDENYWAFSDEQLPRLHSGGLLGRGWVYQERLLSPCSIYFGEQLTWECSELTANEVFPCGASYNSLQVEPKNRLSALLPPIDHFSNDLGHIRETYHTWLMLVRFYSDNQLTFRSDVFPAISGLAHYFNEVLKDNYLAGIWRGDSINGLLWHRMGYPYKTRGWRNRAQDHAPSWSWAAVQGPVQHFPLIAKHPQKYRCLVTIHKICVTPTTPDPMGAVKGGVVRISANLRPNQGLEALADAGKTSFTEGYDGGYKEGVRECQGTFFLVMTCRERGAGSIVCGLIIEPTKRIPHEYERVGAFQFDPKKRREFTDFDPDNLDVQTITLV